MSELGHQLLFGNPPDLSVGRCQTPYCDEPLVPSPLKKEDQNFCTKCRSLHSTKVLLVQVEHNMPIRDVILDATMFRSSGGMADYIGVSFVTIYHWIKKYFGMSFQEFRRKYICKSTKCYLLDIQRSSYSRHDYVLKKIKAQRYCACINALDPGWIMTNAPLSVIKEILRGRPKVGQISDKVFALVPSPVFFEDLPVSTMWTKNIGNVRTRAKRVKKNGLNLAPFTVKVLKALYECGGSSGVSALVEKLSVNGDRVRKNNTRREVYRHSDLFQFDPTNKQIMQLTDTGREKVKSLTDDPKSVA